MGVPRVHSRYTLSALYDWLDANVGGGGGGGLPANSTPGLALRAEDDGLGNIVPTWDIVWATAVGEINAAKLAAKTSLWLTIPFTGKLRKIIVGVTELVITGGTLTANLDGAPVNLQPGGGVVVNDGSQPGSPFAAIAWDSPVVGSGSQLEIVINGTFDSGALTVTACCSNSE